MLVALALVMLIASYLSGSIPLFITFSEVRLPHHPFPFSWNNVGLL